MEKGVAENSIIAESRWANFFGFETVDDAGRKKYHPFVIRGNGTLTLTTQELRFTRFLPKKIFTIPLSAVTDISIGHGHNLKIGLFLPILKVSYRENGATVIFGVCVGWKKSALEWKQTIERTVRER